MTVPAGTILTCTNDTCGCRVELQVPCPHGDDYVCGCGHGLTPVDDSGRPIPPTPGA